MSESKRDTPRASGQRDRIVKAVSEVLAQQRRSASEMQAVVEQCSVPVEEVSAEFPNLDDLVVAIASREAARIAQPLQSILQTDADVGDVRATLIEFASGLHAAYSSVLIGFVRVAMTEGSRRKEIRKRIYDEGPAAVTSVLGKYLQKATAEGKLAVDNSGYAAESLMGMLREPLYQELTLHSQEFTFYQSMTGAVEAAVDIFLNGSSGLEEKA